MKKVFKRILIASTIMVTSFTAGVFTACSSGNSLEQSIIDAGYEYTVTYDANGGSFGSNSTRTYAYVKENSLTTAPGYIDGKTQASVKVPTRRNYQLVGEAKDDNDDDKNEEAIASKSWFVAKTDEDGNVVYKNEGENRVPVLLSETPWNFATDRVTGDITLVAMWSEVFRFSLCIAEPTADGKIAEKEIRSYLVEPGDSIIDKLYDKDKESGTIVRRADYIKVKQTNYTFLDFYLDQTYTTLLASDYTHPGRREVEVTEINPETNQEVTTKVTTNTVTIYVKYLSGKYDFISNKNIRNLTESSKWYLVEDVDYSGVSMDALSKFTGVIYGNGFTLKNLTVTSIALKPTASYKAHSIFGQMGGSIENLTFENVTFNVKTNYGTNVPGEQRANFFAYSFTEKGALNNVTLKDCRILFTDADCYEKQTGTNGGLWWDAPAAGQINNVVLQQNGTVVDSIEIVSE